MWATPWDMRKLRRQKERDRFGAAIYGIVDLCESALFQQEGRATGESSFPSGRDEKEVL
jgi:hypothetical protein